MAIENIEILIKSDAEKQLNPLKDLRKQINSLKNDLLQLEAGTEEYNEKAQELANTQLRLRDINEEARYAASDLGEQLATTNRIATGLASGFSAAQGVMALFGGESEALQKTMVKLQAGIALVQGLQGMEGLVRDLEIAKIQFRGALTGVKGFIAGLSGMKKALLATGIGAFIVLLGTLIANWEEISKLWKDTNPQKEAAKRLKDIRIEVEKLAIQSSTKNILRIKELAKAYKDLGDNLDGKQKFVKEYAGELENMGIRMNDVNDAERIFKDETDAYCNAIKARAKAEALREVAGNQYAERMAEIAELNSEIQNAQEDLYEYGEANQTFWQKVDAFFSRRYGKTMPESYREDAQALIDTMKEEAEKLQDEANNIVDELFAEAKTQDALANEYLITGGSSGGSSGSSSTTDDWEQQVKDFYKERARVLQELNQIEFDALQSQRTDQYDIEIEELKYAKEQEIAILDEYLKTKLKNEKTGEEHSLLTQEEYDKAKIELEKVYSKKIADVEKSRLDNLNQIAMERLEAIDEKFQKAIEKANTQYEINSATANATGDEVTNAIALQTLLEAQNQALITKRDELLAYKSTLDETSDAITAIDAELEVVTNEMALNAHNRTMAIAAEKSAQLNLVNEIVGSISDSMEKLLALDLGVEWADELGMAFSAIQTGITQTSEALKSGQKGWQAYGQMAVAGLNAAAGILNSLAEKQDETDKDGFEKQKKLQIAAATMAMLGGIVSAVTSAFNPANAWMTIWGQAGAAAAMSSFVLATGAMQIANIKKQTMNGGGGDSGGITPPNVSATLMSNDIYANQLATQTEIDLQSEQQKSTRVYVVESDITEAQNSTKTTVSESEF